jgi:hypothetical protein
LLWVAAIAVIFYGFSGTSNFVPSSGWHKMSLVFAAAATAAAVILALFSGLWEKLTASSGAVGDGIMVLFLIAAGGVAFYLLAGRVAPQAITAVIGENARMDVVASSRQISDYRHRSLDKCKLTSVVALINAGKPDDSIQTKLANLHGEVQIAASIPGGFYEARVKICIEEADRRLLPQSDAFAAVLHGKQTAAGFLIEGLEAAES